MFQTTTILGPESDMGLTRSWESRPEFFSHWLCLPVLTAETVSNLEYASFSSGNTVYAQVTHSNKVSTFSFILHHGHYFYSHYSLTCHNHLTKSKRCPPLRILYQLSHKGSPRIFPTQESSRGLLHCRQHAFKFLFDHFLCKFAPRQ